MKKSAFGISSTNSTRKPSAASARLLEAAKLLLTKFAPDEITTAMVLEEAEVALYFWTARKLTRLFLPKASEIPETNRTSSSAREI